MGKRQTCEQPSQNTMANNQIGRCVLTDRVLRGGGQRHQGSLLGQAAVQ